MKEERNKRRLKQWEKEHLQTARTIREWVGGDANTCLSIPKNSICFHVRILSRRRRRSISIIDERPR
jgi:hypothetical protein